VLGRDFVYPLLREVAETDEPAPQACGGRTAAGELSLQARADPGRGLRQSAQEPQAGAARTRR
jgi:hypothetical protein